MTVLGEPVVEVLRSGHLECVHHGALVALRSDGSVALAVGDLALPRFGRSCNKPLQAVALLEQGWDGDPEAVALATASHSGAPVHLEVVRRVLRSAGLSPDALGCPAALPLDLPTAHSLLAAGGSASPLTMNCSGKHAAMLATAVALGLDPASYLLASHPLQVAVAASLRAQTGEACEPVAVDGCGLPQHATTLPGLARAFGAIAAQAAAGAATPQGVVGRAMRAHPELVGGAGRDVTELMQALPGLVAKDGAEGAYAAGLPDGACVAVKVADGATRAATPLLVAGLRALGVTGLEPWATAPVLGGGQPVGEVRVVAALRG